MSQPAPSRDAELRGHLAMLVFSGLVAGSFSLGGRIANEIDPMALTAIRFALAAVVVFVIALATKQIERETFQAPWRFLFLGGLFAMYFVLMFEGLKTAHPVSTAAVFTLTPVMAAGFGWLVMRQVTNKGMALGLCLGAVGALWVIFRGDIEALLGFDVGVGELIFFIGCIAHALYIPMVPKLSRGEGVFAAAFGTMAGGAIVVALFGVVRIAKTEWSSLPFEVWLVLGYLVVFASVASISLIQFASLRLKAANVMAYTYLIPSWVILWEFVLADDVPALVIVPGIALTILALVVLLRRNQSPATP